MPCVRLGNGTTIEFKTMSDFNVFGYSENYLVLRQYYPLALGRTKFVRHASGLLWFDTFDSTTSKDYSMRFFEQADGSFAIKTQLVGSGSVSLYVGYNASIDQLCVVTGGDPEYVSWYIEKSTTTPSQTRVAGLQFGMYDGYFASNTAYFHARPGLQEYKVTTNLTTLSAATNGYLNS
jgi:hypothetical protein